MAAISIQKLSHQTTRCMVMVKAGETVDITEQGTIIGRIVPVAKLSDIRARVIAEGRTRTATGGHAAPLVSVRRRVATEPVDEVNRVTTALLEMREDERY